ncbi:MAG: efflux RND transporter periplasmic adaptor subunit [Rhodocyclaceae bacterium]|nr:MAG: efflux RND transporter periplasmic adaptor subunit [Rhodocyclaceae bacterium]
MVLRTIRMLSGLALTAMLTSCEGDAQKQQAPVTQTPPPLEIDVVRAASGRATVTKDLPGRLQATKTAQVRARVDGIIEKRLYTEGSDVKAGVTLFRIDPRSYQASFDAAKADLAIARVTLERYQPLLEIKAVSRQEVDLADARVKQAEAALTRAYLDLENTSVPAPISGRIGRALVTEGALAGRNEATHLATIEQIDPIYANFSQAGADLIKMKQAVKAGKFKDAERAHVELILEDGSVYAHPGKLLFSDLAVDPATGSISMRAVFPNPRHELLPGTFVQVRFPEAVADQVIRIPQRAVQAGPQGQFVMVVDADNKLVARTVTSSGMSGGDFIIAEGLKGGEQVVVNGLQKVRPGTTVNPVPWNPGAGPVGSPPAGGKKPG